MNDSVRRATGFKRGGGLADLMTPDEMVSLQRMGSELARDADVQALGAAGQGRVTQAIGTMFSDQLPNALTRPIMIINAVLKRTGARASERTMNQIALRMQDPAAMAEIMEMATAAERRAYERAFVLYMTSGAVSKPDDLMAWSRKTLKRGLDMVTSDAGDN